MSQTLRDSRQRVVIVGAGFAGLWAARRLGSRAARKRVTVTIIDRNNYHTFPPLLYQVAAAEIEPEAIVYPIRGIFRDTPNVTAVMSTVTGIDLHTRLVLTDGPPIPYDYLILATGSRTAYFSVPGAEECTFGLKTLEEAVTLRSHILACFERAAMDRENVPEGLLTVAVVGAGATGLEFAGALAELMATPLRRDFPLLARDKAKVILLDGSDHVLMPFPPKLRDYARSRLERMGVTVMTGAAVAEVLPNGVILKDGRKIPACTVVWSAGVMGDELGKTEGLTLGRSARVQVTPTLQVAGRPEVYVAGDLALPEGSSPPTVAPNAIQMGQHAAKSILRAVKGLSAEEYIYWDKGSMVTIGRRSAVAKLGKREFTGSIAWLTWIFVHLMYLVGFRNRMLVLLGWAWDYLFFEKSVRLILPRVDSVLRVCGRNGVCATPAQKED